MKTRLFRTLAISTGVFAFAPGAFAQHYPVGAEGILVASVPPPGVYLRDYNYFYTAGRYVDGPSDFNVFAYCNAPRLVWVTNQKILGADYGVDLVVPFGYSDVKIGGMKDNRFGLGDVEVKPVILAWHPKQFDFCLAYGIWAPTGDFDANRLANLGHGFWTHMLAAGATWYPDEKKTWAVSLMNWYEINQEQEHTHITPGETYSLEWGVSKSLDNGLSLGATGYFQQQTTRNSGPGAAGGLSRVASAGPEISYFIPKVGINVSARYEREFGAANHTEGNTAVLTLTKRF